MLAIGIVGYVLGHHGNETRKRVQKWRTYEYFGVFMMAAALACAAMPFCWELTILLMSPTLQCRRQRQSPRRRLVENL